jgi:hypothetical protein
MLHVYSVRLLALLGREVWSATQLMSPAAAVSNQGNSQTQAIGCQPIATATLQPLLPR